MKNTLIENIRIAAGTSRVIMLHGERQYDRFLSFGSNSEQPVVKLEKLIHDALSATLTYTYDTTDGSVILSHAQGEGAADTSVNGFPDKVGDPQIADDLVPLLKSLQQQPPEPRIRVAFVVEAALLFEEPASPSGNELLLIRQLDKCARTLPSNVSVILKTDNLRALPAALSGSSFVTDLAIPASNLDERKAYSELRWSHIAELMSTELATVATAIARATDGWSLQRVERLIQMVQQLPSPGLADIEVLSHSMMTGVTDSPWLGSTLRENLQNMREALTTRIKGQEAGIDAVCNQLIKSVTGLAGATQSEHSTAPKGVFFFAGPTGTGKTELVKSLAELVYGSETNLIRFDCGELQQEHAVSRLIGAPPGYVGYEAGGELTDAVASKPASVILFDEIEKAHPRLLDTLLSVLDDGRITNGQGKTTYFSDSIIVFTSNLGMHETTEHGRKLRFGYTADFQSDIQPGVRQAIAKEFSERLGRPELLGRIGGKDRIVVFDYLRDITGVIEKFLRNISLRLQRYHELELNLDPAVIDMISARMKEDTESLELGGRGIAQALEREISDPLAHHIFEHDWREGQVLGKLTENVSVEFQYTTLNQQAC